MQMLRQELGDLLDRYDVGAVVILHEPGAVNYVLKVDPSYSLARTKGDNVELLPALAEADGGVPERAAATINLFRNLAGMTRQVLASLAHSLQAAQLFYNLYPPGQEPRQNGRRPGRP